MNKIHVSSCYTIGLTYVKNPLCIAYQIIFDREEGMQFLTLYLSTKYHLIKICTFKKSFYTRYFTNIPFLALIIIIIFI